MLGSAAAVGTVREYRLEQYEEAVNAAQLRYGKIESGNWIEHFAVKSTLMLLTQNSTICRLFCNSDSRFEAHKLNLSAQLVFKNINTSQSWNVILSFEVEIEFIIGLS